jgi:predicted flap endonuclease-1-like 5' DNA nuclease
MMDASMEIFTILLWAFTLGMILGWLLKPNTKGENAAIVKSSVKSKKIFQKSLQEDDLQLIEWIWPKIEELLQKKWVSSFKTVVEMDVEGLESILSEGWKKFLIHSHATWPDQAKLAMKWKWSELEEYQEILNKNKKKKK